MEKTVRRAGRPELPVRPPEDINLLERKILNLVARGMSSKQMVGMISLTEASVNTYCSKMLKRLGMNNRAQLIVWAVRNHHIDETPNGK